MGQVKARKPLVLGVDVSEKDSWGMDCYTRKNLFDAILESGAFSHLRDAKPAVAAPAATSPAAQAASDLGNGTAAARAEQPGPSTSAAAVARPTPARAGHAESSGAGTAAVAVNHVDGVTANGSCVADTGPSQPPPLPAAAAAADTTGIAPMQVDQQPAKPAPTTSSPAINGVTDTAVAAPAPPPVDAPTTAAASITTADTKPEIHDGCNGTAGPVAAPVQPEPSGSGAAPLSSVPSAVLAATCSHAAATQAEGSQNAIAEARDTLPEPEPMNVEPSAASDLGNAGSTGADAALPTIGAADDKDSLKRRSVRGASAAARDMIVAATFADSDDEDSNGQPTKRPKTSAPQSREDGMQWSNR